MCKKKKGKEKLWEGALRDPFLPPGAHSEATHPKPSPRAQARAEKEQMLSPGGWVCHCLSLKKRGGVKVDRSFPSFGFFVCYFFWPCHPLCGILKPLPGIEPLPLAVKAWSPTCGMWHFCVSDLLVTGWPRQGWYWERAECLESCAPELQRLHPQSSWIIRSILMYNEMKVKSRIQGSSSSATDCVFTLSTLFSRLSGC